MYSIKSYGFGPQESDVIKKQVRLISSRTDLPWVYEGEGLDGNIVLAKQHVDVLPGAKLVIVGTVSPADAKACAAVLEYPIRIMKFLELLEKFAPKSALSTAQAVAKIIEDRNAPDLVLLCNQVLVCFKNGNSKVYIEKGGKKDIIEAVSKTSASAITPKNKIPVKDTFSWSSCISSKTLLWSLARREIGYAKSNWSTDKPYKLASWPQVNEWEPNPQIFKLATLYSRQSVTVSEAAKACQLEEDQVKSFLHACATCGISVKASEVHETALKGVRELQNKQSLNWLRKKINSYFGLVNGN